MANWDPKKHPRYPAGTPGGLGGRFIPKDQQTSAWAATLTDRMSPSAPKPPAPKSTRRAAIIRYTPARGKDLTRSDPLAFAAAIDASKTKYEGRAADPELRAIAARQGFDQKPKVVAKTTMDRLERTGEYHELHRGVSGSWSKGVTAEDIQQQLRTGEAFYGFGIYGNGYYFAGNSADGGRNPVSPGIKIAAGYADHTEGSIVRALLPKSANIISIREARSLSGGLHRKGDVYSDEGRAAAAAGYDAILVDHGTSHAPFYVVLNRTALIVQREPALAPVG